ncbi:hypothetical protein [Virgibacillus kimchii]
MTKFTFKLQKREELVNHPVPGSIGYNILFSVSSDINVNSSNGSVEVVVNENGIFPDLEQINKNVNSVVKSSLIIKLKEYIIDLHDNQH